ncbi:MAG: exodeoxyribonuclease V subunit alpha, partial [Gammaproteobacteria bacterium]|nr:exodeoxyribonuclease V subunit alpha [Gammaproteobacteria bacterium]
MQQGQLFGEDNPQPVISATQTTAPQLDIADYLASRDNLMLLLNQWLDADWLRALDVALVKLLAQLEPNAEPLALFATALVSHQLGHGHICLDLHSVLRDPDLALLLPPEGRKAEEQPPLPSQLLAAVSISRWVSALQNSHLLYQQDSQAAKPLVLVDERLYLYRYWHYESSVAQRLVQSIDTVMPLPTDFPQRLTDLFSEPLVVDGQRQTDWQKVACAMAAQGQLTLITGGPGTGKTTTVVRLLALLQQSALVAGQALRIQLAAPTGKAAARLTESIGQQVSYLSVQDEVKNHIPTEVTTLHRLLGSLPNTRHFRYNCTNPLVVDVLVIDEASMIDLEMMHDVLQALPQHARLILLGDKDQLASVEAGSVLGDLCADA